MRVLGQLSIDRHSGETLVSQIIRHVESGAASGRLPFGAKLPSVRDLASQLGVSCSSAAHAYEILSARGITQSRPGSGYYVAIRPNLEGSRTSHSVQQASPRGVSSRPPSPSSQRAKDGAMCELGTDGLAPSLGGLAEVGVGLKHALQDLQPSQCRSLSGPQRGLTLRQMLCSDFENRGIFGLTDDDILLFGNERQALTFLLSQLCPSHDGPIAIEGLSSLAIRDAAHASGCPVVTLPCIGANSDEEWAKLAEERLQQTKAKVVIVMPNFHDPTGQVMSPFCRNRLISLAARLDFKIIEWDVFSNFSFGEVFQTPICALDGLSQSVYVTSVGSDFGESFSLIAVCAREPLISLMRRAKTMAFGVPSRLEEGLLTDLWSRGVHRRQVNRIERTLLHRRELYSGMLNRLAPKGSLWNQPLGGLFFWFCFPEGVDTFRLSEDLESKGIRIAPGAAFGDDPVYSRYMRLNFSFFEPEGTYNALKTVFELACQNQGDVFA